MEHSADTGSPRNGSSGEIQREMAGWGRYPRRTCRLYRPEQIGQLTRLFDPRSPGSYLGRGLGRAYGDAALNSEGALILSERLNRFLEFDNSTGVLRCEAGVTLTEILTTFLPRGWFLPVTPGTKFVTVGGCLACDVHGKNHHVDGSFADHVLSLTLIRGDGTALRCSRAENPEVFWATVGGMGLTGYILDCEFQLRPVETAYVAVEYCRTRDLDETMERIDREDQGFTYSVAWMDCLAAGSSLGRAVLMRGNHCRLDQLEVRQRAFPFSVKDRQIASLPFDLPSFLLNRLSISVMNELYYRSFPAGQSQKIVHYDPYFYPLDSVAGWNRAYGGKGFVQYQCAFPLEQSRGAIERLLETLREHGMGSFLVVVKRFGPAGPGLLSFPFEGYTISLDFPVTRKLLSFLDQLDTQVLAVGGRVYLAKDARLERESFRAMYPSLPEWLRVKREIDPGNCFNSDLARRLELD